VLTKTQIDAAIRDCQGETVLNDGNRNKGEGSLRLRIRRTSAGVNAIWFAHWKKAGERGKKQLGRYPDMTGRSSATTSGRWSSRHRSRKPQLNSSAKCRLSKTCSRNTLRT
jgi:hypothetical protein